MVATNITLQHHDTIYLSRGGVSIPAPPLPFGEVNHRVRPYTQKRCRARTRGVSYRSRAYHNIISRLHGCNGSPSAQWENEHPATCAEHVPTKKAALVTNMNLVYHKTSFLYPRPLQNTNRTPECQQISPQQQILRTWIIAQQWDSGYYSVYQHFPYYQ